MLLVLHNKRSFKYFVIRQLFSSIFEEIIIAIQIINANSKIINSSRK